LAAAVDAEHWSEIAGTLAGDDTVLIITPSRSARAALEKRLKGLLR
jgi:transcriptional regulator of arginine metabolism